MESSPPEGRSVHSRRTHSKLIGIKTAIDGYRYRWISVHRREVGMSYLDPVDTQTMKRIGFNVVALIGVSFALIAVVIAVT
jgi:hypothetical protein